MAYETKVILRSLANQIALAKTTRQAFEMVRTAAQVEGLTIPDMDSVKKQLLVFDSIADVQGGEAPGSVRPELSGDDALAGNTGAHPEHRR